MNVRVLGADLLTVHVRLQFEEQPKQSRKARLADSAMKRRSRERGPPPSCAGCRNRMAPGTLEVG
jgi:hypothetical protein